MLKIVWDYFANHSLTGEQEVDCKPVIHLPDLSDTVKELIIPPSKYSIAGYYSNKDADSKEPEATKKDNKNTDSEEEAKTAAESQPNNGENNNAKTQASNQVCVTKHDGVFMLIVNAYPTEEEKYNKFELHLNVEMKGPHGYLSASDWPLYPFYGFMLLLYVFFGVVWLIASACQWRDLLRIQIWIGGVIALGMLEEEVFFSEYNNINRFGETNPGLAVFADFLSCVKGTLVRILVIVVSMGFDIAKPRLQGYTLYRVLGVGALYFILATIKGFLGAFHPKFDLNIRRQQFIVSIPLTLLDGAILWWIFISLKLTRKSFWIRHDTVKQSLYRHLTYTFTFFILAYVAFTIWWIKTQRFAKYGCFTNWSKFWFDEAFCHFLFSIVLLVIMVLLRPTANNQRYAFSPNIDFWDDDENDEKMTHMAPNYKDGMKMIMPSTHQKCVRSDTDMKMS
ncbi:hypothetical protein ACROYT_G034659 [Oculina patagonica]